MDNDKLDKAAKAHIDAAAPLMAHPGKVFAAFHAGAKWLLTQPLADRLTEEEKEKIRNTLNIYYGKWRANPNEATEAVYCTIKETFESKFGKEFFTGKKTES